jgi:putative nucleotidyltransferase with HDIG domain
MTVLSVVPRKPLPGTPEQMVALAPELEALPVVAQRVLAIVNEERTTIDQLSKLLGTDQALTAAILRQANSASAMPNRRIANLRESLARIGQRAVTSVLIRACAGAMLDRGLPPYALPRRIAWRHSATVSAAAKGLANMKHTALAEEASVAGLLHDVGKVVLTSVAPEAAAEAVSLARRERIPVWQAEEQVLGFNHGAVGAALLRTWGLPEIVVEAVAQHHRPVGNSHALIAIITFADAAASAVGAVGGGGACPQPNWDTAEAAMALGVTPEQVQQFLENLECVEDSEV